MTKNSKHKILFIDATNIHGGGGLIHLIKIVENFSQSESGFEQLVVCASRKTLSRLPGVKGVSHYNHPDLNHGYFRWIRWRYFSFKGVLKNYGYPVLFCAGTIKPPFAYPYYTICQNLLPLEWSELLRYKFSWVTIRLMLLRFVHLRSYTNAEGVIFLTRYCFYAIPRRKRTRIKTMTVIPHGVDLAAFKPEEGSTQKSNSLDLLYVSVYSAYKHQDKVAQAVIELHQEGLPVTLTLVGEFNNIMMVNRVKEIIAKAGALGSCISMLKESAFEEMPQVYANHAVFIFASSCETFGMILTEAMASGKPILCSYKSSMQETLRNTGIYFNPESVESIKIGIRRFIAQPELVPLFSKLALERAKQFTWESTAKRTYDFLRL